MNNSIDALTMSLPTPYQLLPRWEMVGRKWGLGRGNIVKWWLWVAGALLLLWEEFQFVDHEPCFLSGVGVPDGKPLLAEEAHFDVAHGACAAGTEGVAQASAVVV